MICLTVHNEGAELFVNPDQIVTARRVGEYTVVMMVEDHDAYVVETPREIAKLIAALVTPPGCAPVAAYTKLDGMKNACAVHAAPNGAGDPFRGDRPLGAEVIE